MLIDESVKNIVFELAMHRCFIRFGAGRDRGLISALFWGLQQVLIKLTLAEMPPVFQAWLRLGGATVLLLLWCRCSSDSRLCQHH